MIRVGQLALLSTALLIVTAACAPNDGRGAGQRADPPARGSSGDSFAIVAYQGGDELGGGKIEFDSLFKQGRPVVLNFWAAQCPPCRAEMPWFEQAHERYGDRVLLVGVDIGPFVGLGSNEQGRRLLEELDISYPAAYAVDNRAIRRFRVIGMPTTVFFDKQGSVVRSHAGLLTQKQIDDAFQELAEGAR